MDLVTPGIGLIFWTTIIFSTVLLILRLTAWKPIVRSLNERSNSIDQALKSADQAREEMKALKSSNEKILLEAKGERDKLLAEARIMKDSIISDAKSQANEEVKTLIANAKLEVENMKSAAFEDIKNQVIELSVAVAEKVLREELKDINRQERLVEDMIKQANLN